MMKNEFDEIIQGNKQLFDVSDELFNKIISLNDKEKYRVLQKFSDEQKEKFLKYFSNQTILLSTNTNNKTVPESNKPLWVNSVKMICNEIIPKLDIRELEYAKEELIKQNENDLDYIQNENYPYLNTIKKLMYAFGDLQKNEINSVIFLHNFLKKWLLALIKILNECEFKKIIEHLFSHEYYKYFTYKKFKLKSSFKEATISQNEEEEKESKDEIDNDINEEQFFLDENYEKNDQPVFQSIFEEKDQTYYENLAYQDMRTKNMTENEYLEFINCRTSSLLTRGRKYFLNYLNEICNDVPSELKDYNNIDLISFLVKEVLHKIIDKVIRSRNSEKKLEILKFPIKTDELESLCNDEIESLNQFYVDYSSSIYLIKEFKKKKLSKLHNKYVKIKKNKNELFIVIKKIALLDDREADFIKKVKSTSEKNVLKYFKNKRLNEMVPENYYEFFLVKKVQNLKKIDKKILKKFLTNGFISQKKRRRSL